MANFELNVKVNGVEQSISTIGGLEQALAATNAQLSQVEENSKEFTFLKNQAQNLEKVLGALTGDAKAFDQSLKGVNTSAKNLNSTFTQTAQAADNLDDASKAAKNTSNTIKEATGSAASLRAELRQIVQELQTLEPGSARFQELSVRAGELRDQIADTNGVVTALAGNFTERLARGIQSTVSIGVAGFQAITAAQALFGTESEAINQTILKLTALLNLSQALETLGGLGDKVTEIKAAFSSLFPAVQQTTSAVTATTVATTAEATATVGATTATSAWAVALNALPLVAIVTAVGLLVAGLIEYASGSDDAAKAEEERKKKLEEQKAAIDAVVESQAKEGAGLAILLNRLKQTAPASKERKDLLKEINSEYNINLQNLKDEEAFQKQVTKATESYIEQLKNKIALKIVEDQFTATFQRQLEVRRLLNEAENKSTVNTLLLNAATGALNSKLEINNFLGVNLGETLAANQNLTFNLIKTDQARASSAIKLSEDQIKTLKAEDKQLQTNLDNLSSSISDYEALLTGAFDKREKNTKQTNSTLEEQKRLEEEALQKAKEFAEQSNQAEIDLARSRVQRTVDRIDDIEFEKDVKLAQIIVEYETAKKSIEDNIKDEKDRTATLKLLEANLQRQVTAQKLQAAEKEDEIRKESLKKQKEFLEELVLAQDILTKEITFGNNNAADSLDALEQRRKKIEIDRLTREIESNTLSVDDYEAKQKKRQELLLAYNEQEFAINSRQAITERDFQISEIVKFYKAQEKFNIEFNQTTGKYTVTATKEYLDEVKKLNDGSDAKAIETAENVQNVINQSAVNLNKEATVKIEEADANYQNKRVDNDKKANDEILANRLKFAEDLLQIFSQFNDAAAEIEAFRVQRENEAQVAKNEQAAAAAQAQVDALEAAYAQDIANNAYTEEQKQQKRKETDNLIKGLVDSSNKAIDKSNRDLAEKQFKRQKALNITTALINGAQAVLQAIAQFGPPPSPLGIAGIVAAGIITAAQVAAISSQKFDGGASGAPTSVSTPPLSDVSTPTATTGQSLQQLTGGFTSFTDQATGAGAGSAPSTGSATFTSAQKVYVLESDITAAQDRVRVLENNSTFG